MLGKVGYYTKAIEVDPSLVILLDDEKGGKDRQDLLENHSKMVHYIVLLQTAFTNLGMHKWPKSDFGPEFGH